MLLGGENLPHLVGDSVKYNCYKLIKFKKDYKHQVRKLYSLPSNILYLIIENKV